MNRPDQSQESRQWAMFLHFSQLSNFVIPLGGIIVPIVIWQLKKEELPGIDEHGRMVTNWIISSLIYGVVGAISSAVIVGFIILAVVFVCSIVFPIIGGLKANKGLFWKYPLTLEFLK
ncbi:MAG: DUF4870 domain-containing protein [Cyanobacteria bacterium P01_G01_bin.54]